MTELPVRLTDWLINEFGELPLSFTYEGTYGFIFWMNDMVFRIRYDPATDSFKGWYEKTIDIAF